MSQNKTVMANRREAHDSLDDFPTPPWAVRALIEQAIKPLNHLWMPLAAQAVWEPACNRGFMARPLGEYFGRVIASDIHDYGYAGMNFTGNFLFPQARAPQNPDWIITNPPFRLAERFIERALDLAEIGVAVLVRTAFLEGQNRYERLFSRRPPKLICQFAERVAMVKGKFDPGASTATAYCWLVWFKGGAKPPEFLWIKPCRKQLTRPEDAP